MFQRRNRIFVLVFLVFLLAGGRPAYAQEGSPLLLKLSRNFGYSSGGGDIQGNFTVSASGPQDLSRVVFLIDGETMGEATQPPFELKFSTGSYTPGMHTLSAIGYTARGDELSSNEQRRLFLSAEEARQQTVSFILPLVVVILGVMLLSFLLPVLLGRGKKSQVPLGASRSYGILGGAICPKCGRPFAVHAWGLNIVVGKLDRCPHCGKWSVVQRSSPQALRAAEDAELEMGKESQPSGPSTQPDFEKELEDSRYQDL
jgi:Bacterial Ig domain